MGLSDLTAPAVNQAIEEFKQLKRKAFLKKYKFGPARGYLLEQDGRTFDSKPIAGAAHGYLPGRQPLTAKDFSGGEATVRKQIEALGFRFVNGGPQPLPSPGDVLTNAEISRRFDVGNMGGMRRSTKRAAAKRLWLLRRRTFGSAVNMQASNDEHASIFDAIIRKQPDIGRRRAEDHGLNGRKRFLLANTESEKILQKTARQDMASPPPRLRPARRPR